MRRALSVALFALLMATPLSLAQVPGVPVACGPFSTSVTAPAEPVAPGAIATLSYVVTNGGNLTATVTAVATSAIAGWTITSEFEQDATIASQDSATFQFTVTPAADAPPEGRIDFASEAVCSAGAVGCPAGQTTCRASGPPQSATLSLAAPGGFAIPGLQDLDISPEILGAAVLLLAAAFLIPLLLRKRRAPVTATCPEPLKLLKPGHGASFPIEVRNRAKDAVTATFEVGAVPQGWSAFMAMPDLQLASGETRSLWLMVRAPLTASTGDVTDVPVRVKLSNGESVTLRVRAEVHPDVPDSRPPGSSTSPAP